MLFNKEYLHNKIDRQNSESFYRSPRKLLLILLTATVLRRLFAIFNLLTADRYFSVIGIDPMVSGISFVASIVDLLIVLVFIYFLLRHSYKVYLYLIGYRIFVFFAVVSFFQTTDGKALSGTQFGENFIVLLIFIALAWWALEVEWARLCASGRSKDVQKELLKHSDEENYKKEKIDHGDRSGMDKINRAANFYRIQYVAVGIIMILVFVAFFGYQAYVETNKDYKYLEKCLIECEYEETESGVMDINKPRPDGPEKEKCEEKCHERYGE